MKNFNLFYKVNRSSSVLSLSRMVIAFFMYFKQNSPLRSFEGSVDAKLHNQMREKVFKELENFSGRRKVQIRV